MAVYGYCRVSTLAQAEDGESLDAQRRQILGRAMQEGWTIEHIFIERGVSAAKPFAEREEGASLLASPACNPAMSSWPPSSTGCSGRRSMRSRPAIAFGARASRSAAGPGRRRGDVSGNGTAGLFMKIAAAFADFERDRLRERIRDVKEDQRKRGLHLGGRKPFGFRITDDRRLVPDPSEQTAIARMRELRQT